MTNKIDNAASQVDGLAWMKEEYRKKEALLQATFGQPVDPVQYNDVLFHGDSSAGRVVVWTQAGRGQHIHVYRSTAAMLDACAKRRDAAVAPAEFFKDIRNKATMKSLHALTVDLDGVAHADLMALIQHRFMDLAPTYVVNSGRGLHLVFLFDVPVECYDWSKKILDRMLKALKQRFTSIWLSYEVDDKPSLIQIYRIVGSRTKLGTTCHAYRSGTPYTVDGLAAALGVTWCRPQPRQQASGWIHDSDSVYTLPNGRQAFYACVRDGIIAHTQRGHRHLALFALGVVAAKCRVSQDVLQADARRVQQAFNARDPHDKVPTRDVVKALKSVDPRKAKTVRAATLEDWLGWSFERKTKRNGRTRQEHLANVAATRTTRSRDAVAAYMDQHPDATVADVVAATGLSRPTVTRYRRQYLATWQVHAAAAHVTPTQAPTPSAAQAMPQAPTDRAEERDKRELARLVASIVDPATDPHTRDRLLLLLPPAYRAIVAGWLSGS